MGSHQALGPDRAAEPLGPLPTIHQIVDHPTAAATTAVSPRADGRKHERRRRLMTNEIPASAAEQAEATGPRFGLPELVVKYLTRPLPLARGCQARTPTA
jgi:hypothetical protein